MKIILSCCGEGFGHASRLIALTQKLSNHHKVICFCPASVSGFIHDAVPGIEIFNIPVLSFSKRRGRVQYLKTMIQNFVTIAQLPIIAAQLSSQLLELNVDAVITDFDPFTSCAAQRLGIPNLEINHPGIVLRTFSFSPDALVAKLVSLFMESFFTDKINCSFYKGDVGPIIRDEIIQAKRSREDFFLVYFTGAKKQKVLEILEPFKEVNFRIFPDPNIDFVHSLSTCKGVITTAGHQMISESIFLGKPLFVIPQRGQYEQRLNAKMLEKSGWGMQSSLNKLEKSLPSFFDNIESFPRKMSDTKHVFTTTQDRDTVLNVIDKFLHNPCRKQNKKRYRIASDLQPFFRNN